MSPERHAVHIVRTVDERGLASEQRWVGCSRLSKSVPLSVCRGCQARPALRYHAGEVTEVYCPRPTACAAETPNASLSLPRRTIADLMSREVTCVTEDMSLDLLTLLLVGGDVQHAPVLNGRGELVGMVSEADVILHVQAHGGATEPCACGSAADGEENGARATVRDVMSPFVLVMPEQASVTRAAAVMSYERAEHVVAVSDTGAVVGLLSAGDVLYWLARADGFLLDPPHPSERP